MSPYALNSNTCLVTYIRKFISITVLVAFFLNSTSNPAYAKLSQLQLLGLPAPGTMVNLSPAYMPVMIKGVKVHKDNPLLFDFILDTGKSGLKLDSAGFKSESQKLIKYFLAALTIKEDDLWVNLSPYEKNRMIPQELGQTEMGQDMLAQDYILKQLTSSLIYPEKELGKKFWNNVYTKALQMYGTTDVPVNTFNKVWIVADKAKVLEQNNAAYVVGSHLKIMLEEDYLALEKHQGQLTQLPTRGHAPEGDVSPSTLPTNEAMQLKAPQRTNRSPSNSFASQIVKEIILPELEKEVNQGKNFTPLRQMFYAMILASWYKLELKESLLNQVYSNKGKTSGVLSDDPKVKEKIYQQYLKAYKKGVFNYIKEDTVASLPPAGRAGEGELLPIPRKYFSGGLQLGIDHAMQVTHGPSAGDDLLVSGDMAMVTTSMNSVATAAKNKSALRDPAMESNNGKHAERLAESILENRRSMPFIDVSFEATYFGQYFKKMMVEVFQHEWSPDRFDQFKAIDDIREALLAVLNSPRRDLDFLKKEITELKRIEITGWPGTGFDEYNKPLCPEINQHQDVRGSYWVLRVLTGQYSNPFRDGQNKRNLFLESLLRIEITRQMRVTRQRGEPVFAQEVNRSAESLSKELLGEISSEKASGADISREGIKKMITEIVNDQNVLRRQKSLDTLYATLKNAQGIRIIKIISLFHPDINPNDLIAAEIFKLLSAMNEANTNKDLPQAIIAGRFNNHIEAIQKALNPAPAGHKDASMTDPGGIDLNALNMGLEISREGLGVKMTFDPALLEKFKSDDFSGIVPVILKITPVKNPLAVLASE
ncbi:MAG: recombinase family protein [Candidatus Omnitrophica bacterium]|nr:recombinase family protein [Candidatus Omnitrophota bacterium]